MGVPKKRRTPAATGSHWIKEKIKRANLAKCSNCQEAVMPHMVCSNCGHYRGRKVT